MWAEKKGWHGPGEKKSGLRGGREELGLEEEGGLERRGEGEEMGCEGNFVCGLRWSQWAGGLGGVRRGG